jgi:2-(1,2-epoxy-1,2-dihydrophenyl)acetyl-CoA isomerase
VTNVQYTLAGGVATITLDRPEAMNSLNTDTKVELRDAVLRAAGDTAARAVVLTGSGRAFCVGQDLKEHADSLAADAPGLHITIREHFNPMVAALATMPKPVVAGINGVAAGAGASLAFACDFRIVAESAGFNLAFAAIGLSGDTGSTWTLPRLVGWAKARELLMMPRTIRSDEALALGLATEVVGDDKLASRAAELAAQLAAGPTVAYAAIRAGLAYSATHTFADALEREAELMSHCAGTDDHRNAVTAFLNKQPPTFAGE